MPVDAAVIADKVQRVLAAVPAEQACDPGYVAHTIRAEAGGIMSDVEVLSVLRKLRHDSVGVGPLEQVLSLPGVTDVLVNGTQGVWFDRGRGLEAVDIGFASEREVRQLATRLLVSAGRRLDVGPHRGHQARGHGHGNRGNRPVAAVADPVAKSVRHALGNRRSCLILQGKTTTGC